MGQFSGGNGARKANSFVGAGSRATMQHEKRSSPRASRSFRPQMCMFFNPAPVPSRSTREKLMHLALEVWVARENAPKAHAVVVHARRCAHRALMMRSDAEMARCCADVRAPDQKMTARLPRAPRRHSVATQAAGPGSNGKHGLPEKVAPRDKKVACPDALGCRSETLGRTTRL